MDIKGQVTRGTIPGDWDQRKSEGEFRGAPEGLHVSTAVEFRAEGDAAELLTNPERLAEFVQEGDNALTVVNRILSKVTELQPESFGQLASLLRLGGTGKVEFGFYAYDND